VTDPELSLNDGGEEKETVAEEEFVLWALELEKDLEEVLEESGGDESTGHVSKRRSRQGRQRGGGTGGSGPDWEMDPAVKVPLWRLIVIVNKSSESLERDEERAEVSRGEDLFDERVLNLHTTEASEDDLPACLCQRWDEETAIASKTIEFTTLNTVNNPTNEDLLLFSGETTIEWTETTEEIEESDKEWERARAVDEVVDLGDGLKKEFGTVWERGEEREIGETREEEERVRGGEMDRWEEFQDDIESLSSDGKTKLSLSW
jgi:hypothetical protein